MPHRDILWGHQHRLWLIDKSGEILNLSKQMGILLYRSAELFPARPHPRVTELMRET